MVAADAAFLRSLYLNLAVRCWAEKRDRLAVQRVTPEALAEQPEQLAPAKRAPELVRVLEIGRMARAAASSRRRLC